jgi:hypothetical protein
MHHSTLKRQKGVTLSGLLMWSVILVMIALLGMKLAPVYMEYASIQKILSTITNDPAMKNAKLMKIRQSFRKRAQIDYITVVNARDIKIEKENEQTVLRIDYSVTIPLFANLSLLIDFEATSN